MSLVVCVPTIREDCIADFKRKWQRHLDFYNADLLVIYDGEVQTLELNGKKLGAIADLIDAADLDLVPKFTDSCRNATFLYAAKNLAFDNLITFDDDVAPIDGTDPIGDHLRILRRRVPVSWINTLCGVEAEYVRGIPYQIRNEASVEISHGTWIGVPDYDGCTQLRLTPQMGTEKFAKPQFYVGPFPKGVYAAICGMSIAATRDAVPYLFYAPQGRDIGYQRWADIWMGISILEQFWERNWAVYSGASTILHNRASNTFKNIIAESTGLEVNEKYWNTPDSELPPFFAAYTEKRLRFQQRMSQLLERKCASTLAT
jgi:reversibly glycosylated polypeptide/UDP-arabinopyranose mutase